MGMFDSEENMEDEMKFSLVCYGKLINFLFFHFSITHFFILLSKLTYKD